MEAITNKTLVIIVTYNGMKWLERCLNSIVNSSIPLDAYIVDNGSTDGSQQFITSNYPQFVFYQSPTNSGFGAANNIGLQYAIQQGYDYVYLLNQDAWIMPDTIETLIKINKDNPEYGVLSPLQTNAEQTKLDSNFEYFAAKGNNMLSDCILKTVGDIYKVDFIMAAHWLISRECLLKVGLFSPVFHHYGEDDNYLHRAVYHGYKAGVVPSVIGVHDREFREFTKEKDIYFLTITFLVITSNINRSFKSSVVKAYLKTLEGSIVRAIKYRDFFIPFSTIPLLFKLRRIYRDRQRCKNIINAN